MLDYIVPSIQNIFMIQNVIFMSLGVSIGIIFGAIPGLTATAGVALFLPITFGMNPLMGILMLLGIYVGGIYGGSITAILIKTPGTPASAATTFDGYPLAKQGRAGEALKMALYASTIAGIISALALLFIAPQLARFALRFGPPEFFALAVFGLTIISVVSADNLLKGLMAGMVGILISTIGLDPIGGMLRFTFGVDNLTGGINLIPALVGLFAISEIFNRVEEIAKAQERVVQNFADNKLPFKKLKKYFKTIVKSSFIGTFVGAIPGTGAAIASFLSYNEAVRVSKNPENFGKGELDGVAASEAGNNGVTGATLIPLLTLGIPGDTVTAILLGALMIQGLTPGPMLFQTHGELVYSIMIGMIVVNIIMLLIASLFINLFVKITNVPIEILLPIILGFCFVGAFAVNNNIFDIKVMMVFGIIGYVLQKLDFSTTPLLLAIILGPMAEVAIRRTLVMSRGSLMIFLQRPIALFFLIIAFATITTTFYKSYKKTVLKKGASNV